MSYSIGQKIKELRVQGKVSQEDIASVLGISRQRVAKIESGQSEVTFRMIQKIAEYFAIPISDITSADEEVDLKICFRDIENSDEINTSVDKIVYILKTFHAHEKLYYRMKVNSDDN